VKFVVNEKGWQSAFHDTDGLLGHWMEERAIYLMLLAQSQVGVKTGALRTSMRWSLSHDPMGLVATVGSELDYALLHHEGTRPHAIFPRTKSTLRFVKDGKIVYAKMVNHPGTQPNRYLTDNLPKIFDKTS
jgi:hypothetical protein